jgi:hypothetical protein
VASCIRLHHLMVQLRPAQLCGHPARHLITHLSQWPSNERRYAILFFKPQTRAQLSEADLRAQLKRLNLDYGANIPVSVQATHQTVTIENFLSQAQRSNYLEQSRVGADGTSKRGGKRGRGGDDDNVQYEWRWGPRAHSEIGEQGIGRFLAEFMAERSTAEQGDDDSDDDGAERQRALRKMTEKRFQGIETAAGGTLHDVR